MISHLQLSINNDNSGRILHITDTHLFADENRTLLGVNSNASFLSVINDIESQDKKFDLIVATGDFVQDGSQKGYARFADRIKQLNIPCVWLAGNHDNYTYMKEIFDTYQLASNKAILLGDRWLVILLNSQVVGQAYGYLSKSELNFLQNTLQNYLNRSVLVFLHHHPIESGCHWLDEHALKNSHELEKIIQSYPNIKSLGWGHIHQSQELIWHGCTAFSTPSTCVQFQPACHNFRLSEKEAPGWREIKLSADGTIKTKVKRISGNLFLPDMSQNGY